MLKLGKDIIDRVIRRVKILDNEFQEEILYDALNALVDDEIIDFEKSVNVLSMDISRQVDGGHSEIRALVQREWCSSLNLLTLQWAISQEIIEGHAAPDNADERALFFTLRGLVAKGLLISNEIRCLLAGGYPDGALARWRALYELALVAAFIRKHGPGVAERYRINQSFVLKREAVNYNMYHDRIGLPPIGQEQMSEIESDFKLAQDKVGKAFNGELGWAAEVLGIKKGQVGLQHIEQDVNMEHWRPIYKWSCQHNHAGFRGLGNMLADIGRPEIGYSVGPNYHGFSDPLQFCSITLLQLTGEFIRYPNSTDVELVSMRLLSAISTRLKNISVGK